MNNEKTVKGLWAVVKINSNRSSTHIVPNYIPVKIEDTNLNSVTFHGWAYGERLYEYPRASIMITVETEEAAMDYINSIKNETVTEAEARKRISYRGYIIRPRKSDDGELYYDIIKPKWSTTEPIWDWCDSVEEAKQWIDSDKDEPFEESASGEDWVKSGNAWIKGTKKIIHSVPVRHAEGAIHKYEVLDDGKYIGHSYTLSGAQEIADGKTIKESIQQPLDIEDVKDIIATAYSYDQGEDGPGRLQDMIENFLDANGASEDNATIFDGVSDDAIRELYDKLYDYYKKYIAKYGSDDIDCRVYDKLNLSQFETDSKLTESKVIPALDNGYHHRWEISDTIVVHDDGGVYHVVQKDGWKNTYIFNSNDINEVNEFLMKNFDVTIAEAPDDKSINDDDLAEPKLNEDEKDDILFTVAMGFETGHHACEDFDEFESEFSGISNAKAGWEYYCELVNLGPAGFYAEHKDDYIFDDMFVAEYGDGDLEQSNSIKEANKIAYGNEKYKGYMIRRDRKYGFYNVYDKQDEMEDSGFKTIDAAKEFIDSLEQSNSIKESFDEFTCITVLADDCGKNTFKISSRDIRFTFDSEDDKTKFANELLAQNIAYSELPFGVISINKSAVNDDVLTESEGRKATHTSTVYLVDYDDGLSLPFDDRDTAIDYAIDSDAKQVVKATMYHFSDDESDTDIDGDNSEVIWTAYPNLTTENLEESSKPDKFNVIDLEGNGEDDNREYTQTQMYDFCKELIEIEEASSEPEQWAKRPKLTNNLKSIVSVLKWFDYEVRQIVTVTENLEESLSDDEDTSILEKMTNESYDPLDVYSTYEIKNADTDEVIRKIHTTSMDPDDSSTWFDDDDIISQYAGDGIIITRYDYDQGMLDKSAVIYPEEDEDAINAIYDGNANGICTEDINESENVQKWAIFADDRFQMYVNGTEDMAKEAIADMQKADEEDKALFIAHGLDMPVYRYELVKYVQSENPEISNMFKVEENFRFRQSNGIIG